VIYDLTPRATSANLRHMTRLALLAVLLALAVGTFSAPAEAHRPRTARVVALATANARHECGKGIAWTCAYFPASPPSVLGYGRHWLQVTISFWEDDIRFLLARTRFCTIDYIYFHNYRMTSKYRHCSA
jgi:hypothetical protein